VRATARGHRGLEKEIALLRYGEVKICHKVPIFGISGKSLNMPQWIHFNCKCNVSDYAVSLILNYIKAVPPV
jgi:hypothetical protein